MEVVNDSMINLGQLKGWNLEEGNPVTSTWISADGNYGFVEFRSAKEANLGFEDLQGLHFMDTELRFGRPKSYNDSELLGVQGADPMSLQGALGLGNVFSGEHFAQNLQHLLITSGGASKRF